MDRELAQILQPMRWIRQTARSLTCGLGRSKAVLGLSLTLIPLGCQSETGSELQLAKPAKRAAAPQNSSIKPTETTPLAMGVSAAGSGLPTVPVLRNSVDIIDQSAATPLAAHRLESGDPVELPTVVMSQQHQDSCRIKVGSSFPDLQLTAEEGELVSLHSLIAERPSVVFFWSSTQPMSRALATELEQLSKQLKSSGAGQSAVAIIAVHVGDNPIDREIRDATPNLIHARDQSSEAFAQVATIRSFPRSFVISRDSQVLWLDIEFSRDTRRDLRDAISYVAK